MNIFDNLLNEKHEMLGIDRKAREQAKENKMYLWQIRIDGRFANKSTQEFSGVLPDECVDELLQLIRKWMREGKI